MENRKIFNLIIFIFLISSFFIVGFSQLTEANSEDNLVSIMFFETDLREALKEISLQTDIIIIPDETVRGVVTAEFDKIPLEKVLRVILIGGGYSFRKIDDFYLVGLPDPNNSSFGELSQIEIIKLKHREVKEIISLMPSFLEDYVKGNPDEDILTISAPPAELKKICNFIKKIDRPRKQVEVKVVVTEVGRDKIKELGVNLLEFRSDQTTNKKISYDNQSNLLVLEGDYYGKLLTELKILERNKEAKIEADPRVMVADGESAQLFIGEEQTLLINSNDDSKSWTEEIRVGVGLDVTANITGDSQVKMKIAPSISHFLDQSSSDLTVRESRVSTTLQVTSGQTILLAGMTLKDDNKYQEKVPVLGDIPLVRWLFKSRSLSSKDRELLIFVTPVIKD